MPIQGEFAGRVPSNQRNEEQQSLHLRESAAEEQPRLTRAGLAAAFKREVIAEGVESVAHGTALLNLGCELAQGYGIARPMPADQLHACAATWRPNVTWRERP